MGGRCLGGPWQRLANITYERIEEVLADQLHDARGLRVQHTARGVLAEHFVHGANKDATNRVLQSIKGDVNLLWRARGTDEREERGAGEGGREKGGEGR